MLDARVMIQHLEGKESTRASAIVFHMHRGFDVEADSQGLRIGICLRIYPPEVVKDGVGLSCFFRTLG